MILYKWSVEKLVVTGGTNLVTQVHWRCDATDDVNSLATGIAGVRNLVAGDTFIPYNQLTEQQVLDWCFAPEVITWIDIDNVEQSSTRLIKDEGEAQVTGQIERRLAQAAAEPKLPWVT